MQPGYTRNENAPVYYEILVAAHEFLDLAANDSQVGAIHIKPDRAYGADHRIEDLTKFYRNGAVQVIQIKHTLLENGAFGSSDLWVDSSSFATQRLSRRNEGSAIFKFLKSWRVHARQGASVRLTIVGNRRLRPELASLLRDLDRVRHGKLAWSAFRRTYAHVLSNIAANCSDRPFTSSSELRAFLLSLEYDSQSSIEQLDKELRVKVRKFGVVDDYVFDAFKDRVHRQFLAREVSVTPEQVLSLIKHVKTGLLQTISTPPGYIPRPMLEGAIVRAIDKQKHAGGFVTLFAPSGSGKTVLLSKLAEKFPNDFLPYYCRIRPFEAVKGQAGQSNANRLNGKWFKVDIIQRCYEFGLIERNVGITDSQEFVDKVFDKALTTLSQKALAKKSKRIVIIVDALDQVATDRPTGVTVLDAIPASQYPGVVFLLSTWGEQYLPASIRSLPNSASKPSRIDLYFTEEEVAAYFAQAKVRLTRDQVALVHQRTGGLAISLLYLTRKLSNVSTRDTAIAELGRTDAVFNWYRPLWASLTPEQQRSLGYFCFHFAKVNGQDLRNITSSRMPASEFAELQQALTPFLVVRQDSIEPYHDSFRRFVIAKFKSQRADFHRALAKYYSSRSFSSLYAKKYLIKHVCALGRKDPSAQAIFNRLHRTGYFAKVLASNLDDGMKVEIGRAFVDYFAAVGDAEHSVQYAIRASHVCGFTYDEEVGQKASIGTERFVAEIDKAMQPQKSAQPWRVRQWVFDRMRIGNALREHGHRSAQELAARMLDDSLFRISHNRDLLWDEEAQHDFWDYAESYACALVNTQHADRALAFFRRDIRFRKPSPELTGLRCAYLARVHLQHNRRNRRAAVAALAKAPPIERLVTYLTMADAGLRCPDRRDFQRLMRDESLERFLYEDKDGSQVLALAEQLYLCHAPGFTRRIRRLLERVKLDVPYYSRDMIFWEHSGAPRSRYLRWTALRSLVDPKFVLRDFYLKALRDHFARVPGRESECFNEEFLKVIAAETDLGKLRLLSLRRRCSWLRYWKVASATLQHYYNQAQLLRGHGGDYVPPDVMRKLYPYQHEFPSLLQSIAATVARVFPRDAHRAAQVVDTMLGDRLRNSAQLLEILIAELPGHRQLADILETYIQRAWILRQRDQLDNFSKSSGLRELAVLAAAKGYSALAEDIFLSSQRYSRGLWQKEDLRIDAYIDCLRTQGPSEFAEALLTIERTAGVVGGLRQWILDFLGSATYANFELALDYLYNLVAAGKVDQNAAIRAVISAYVLRYPYTSKDRVLPLLDLLTVRGEQSYDFAEDFGSCHLRFAEWMLANADYSAARRLLDQYMSTLAQDFTPPDRLRLLREVIPLLGSHPLDSLRRQVAAQTKQLELAGYRETPRNTSTEPPVPKGLDLEAIRTAAKRGQIGAIIRQLDPYAVSHSYSVERIIAGLLPLMNYRDIDDLRAWGKSKSISLDGPDMIAASLVRAVQSQSADRLRKAKSAAARYLQSAELGSYAVEVISHVQRVAFPGKRRLMRQLLLAGIRRFSGSSYSLAYLFVRCWECLDEFYPELKRFAYNEWKKAVMTAMRLSLSK